MAASLGMVGVIASYSGQFSQIFTSAGQSSRCADGANSRWASKSRTVGTQSIGEKPSDAFCARQIQRLTVLLRQQVERL